MRSAIDPNLKLCTFAALVLAYPASPLVETMLRHLLQFVEALQKDRQRQVGDVDPADGRPPTNQRASHRRACAEEAKATLPTERELTPEEVAALASAREPLLALAGLLRVIVEQLRQMDERLPLPPQPLLALAEESDIGADLYPTLGLSGDLQCFAHDLSDEASKLEAAAQRLSPTAGAHPRAGREQ